MIFSFSLFYRQLSRQRIFWPSVHDWSRYIQTLSPDKRHLVSTVVQVNARAGARIPARSWTAKRDCRLHPMLRALSSRERDIYIKYTYMYNALGFVGKRWERVRERSKPAGSLSPGMTTAHGPSIDLGEHCAPERAALEASLSCIIGLQLRLF